MQTLRQLAVGSPSWHCVVVVLLALARISVTLTVPSDPEPTRIFDAVILGATPGGIAAAVSAARLHSARVALIAREAHVGGMEAGGLGFSDVLDVAHFGARGFFRGDYAAGIVAYYTTAYGADSEQVRLCANGTHHEPHVAEAVFLALLEQAGVTLFLNRSIVSVERARMPDGRPRRIAAILTVPRGSDSDATAHQSLHSQSGVSASAAPPSEVFRAVVFIDATYEGDLLALAGEPYVVGREPRTAYNELNAGVVFQAPATHTFLRGSTGTGDAHVPGYTYRLCLTTNESLAVPMRQAPVGYNRSLYEGYLADYAAGRLPSLWSAFSGPRALPNGKFDMNTNPRPLGFAAAFGTTHKDAYPDGTYAVRDAVVADLRSRTAGLLYFLQTDPNVPAADRAEACRYNFTRDEFADNGFFPPQLYVREARRLQGRYVFTEADMVPNIVAGHARPMLHSDSIAAGEFPTDAFPASPTLPDAAGIAAGGASEGYVDMDRGIMDVYTLPRRVLLPPTADNLVVPVAMSASHVAFSSVRVEPFWMTVGVAAGTWTALALASASAPANLSAVPALSLQAALVTRGEALVFYDDLSAGDTSWPCFQLLGPYGLAEPVSYSARPADNLSRGLAADWLNATLTARIPGLTLPQAPTALPAPLRWDDLAPGDAHYATVVGLALLNITSPAPAVGHGHTFRPTDHITVTELQRWVAQAAALVGVVDWAKQRTTPGGVAMPQPQQQSNVTRGGACQSLMALALA